MNLPLTTQMADFDLHLNTNQMEDKVFRWQLLDTVLNNKEM
jgi:hypothetical protein